MPVTEKTCRLPRAIHPNTVLYTCGIMWDSPKELGDLHGRTLAKSSFFMKMMKSTIKCVGTPCLEKPLGTRIESLAPWPGHFRPIASKYLGQNQTRTPGRGINISLRNKK